MYQQSKIHLEMDEFLNTYNVTRVNNEEIENTNRPVMTWRLNEYSKASKTEKKSQGLHGFPGDSTKHLKK